MQILSMLVAEIRFLRYVPDVERSRMNGPNYTMTSGDRSGVCYSTKVGWHLIAEIDTCDIFLELISA